MFIPHVGQEVVVSFEEGDPDRPLITGRVYNPDQMPALPLPANKTKCVIRDHGGNHIRMEGASGSEQIHLYSPFAETKLSLGAPNRSPGVYIGTKANALWDVAKNYVEKVIGSKTVLTTGDTEYKLGGDWKLTVDKATDAIFHGKYSELYNGSVDIKYDKPKVAIHGGAVSDTFIGLKHGTFIGLEYKLNASVSWEKGLSKSIKNIAGEVKIDSASLTKIIGGGGDADYCQLRLDSGQAVLKCGSSKIVIKHDGDIFIFSQGDMGIQAKGNMTIQAKGGTLKLKADTIAPQGKLDHANLTVDP